MSAAYRQSDAVPCSGCSTPLRDADILYAPDTGNPICQACLSRREVAAHEVASVEAMKHDRFALERKGINAGPVGGIIMMVLAGVWFLGGLAVGRIFFYPPVLFVMGLVACFRGGNKKAGF